MQAAPNQCFSRNSQRMNLLPEPPPAKSPFSPLTLMSGIFYPQPPYNQSFGQPHPPQPIDSKQLAPKCFIIYLFPVAAT
jgi:hypothetical protein